jgi:hypothetical protein
LSECYKTVCHFSYINRGNRPAAQKVSFLSRMLQNILPFFIHQPCGTPPSAQKKNEFLVQNVTKQSASSSSNYETPTSAPKVSFLFRTFRNSLPFFKHGTPLPVQTVSFLSRTLQNSLQFCIHQPYGTPPSAQKEFLVQNVSKQSTSFQHGTPPSIQDVPKQTYTSSQTVTLSLPRVLKIGCNSPYSGGLGLHYLPRKKFLVQNVTELFTSLILNLDDTNYYMKNQ